MVDWIIDIYDPYQARYMLCSDCNESFMVLLRQRHWVAAKHILRYLKGTITYGLRYTSSGGLFMHRYADADAGG